MPRKLGRRLVDAAFGTPWDRLLRRARLRGANRFIVFWNRGLGDIALGLYQVVADLKERVPTARITVVTRAELAECFAMLPVDEVVVDPELLRGDRDVVRQSLRRAGVVPEAQDVVLADLDPTRWFRTGRRLQPVLAWPPHAAALASRFDALFDDGGSGGGGAAAPVDIAVHVSSETAAFYTYRKDWPVDRWRALHASLSSRRRVRFVLLGLSRDEAFDDLPVIDLRGRTTLLEMLAVVVGRCRVLVAPDSGVLTMAYFLGVPRPLDIVSLWADPRQGILKDHGASPNPLLRHVPLVGDDERVENIPVDEVAAAVETLLAERLDEAG